MGADMTEGTLVKWVKQVGDQVNRGEVLAEIETDKATVELEGVRMGVLKKLVVEEGETVPVGRVVAILGAADEQVEGETPRQPAAETPARRGHGEASARQNAGTTTAQREEAPPPAPETEQMHVNITPGPGRSRRRRRVGWRASARLGPWRGAWPRTRAWSLRG